MNSRTLQVAVLSKVLPWGGVFSVLLVSGIIYFGAYYSGLSRQVAQKDNYITARIQETESFIHNSQDMNAMLTGLEKEGMFLRSRTLKAGEHAKVISAVAEATRDQNITISSFKPVFSDLKDKAKIENKPLLPVFFELKMECDYKQLGGFFEALQAAPLLLTVSGYDLQTEGLKPGLISADITLSAYEEWSNAG